MSIVLHSDLVIKNGFLAQELIVEGNWRYSQPAMKEYAEKKELYLTRDLYLRRIVSDARYKTLKDLLPRIGDDQLSTYKQRIDLNNLFASGWGSNEDADEELRLLFGVQKLMDYPKPVRLLQKLLASYRNTKDSYVLDFFSGSATTAHAVMQLNAEDGGNRKFIMVQLPEKTEEKSPARKAGYKNICEIGKERIRRAGAQIRKDIATFVAVDMMPLTIFNDSTNEDKINSKVERKLDELSNLDIGFRVLKLDSTNMKNVYYNPADYEISLFDTLANNIKEDRTPEDLLFQVMLDLGVLLSSKIEESIIGGKKVFNVADGFLYACFDENVSEDVITEIAKKQPYYFVMRDSSMASDSVATNFEQIFATYSPDTVRKVL